MSRTLRYIALEGVDGTGKTTTARALAEQTGAHLIVSPAPPFETPLVREYVDHMGDERIRALYYRTAVQHESARVSELLQTQEAALVVSDRSAVSTWVQAWQRMPEVWRDWALFVVGLRLPDLVVLLTTPADVRDERLRRRIRWPLIESRSRPDREENSIALTEQQEDFRRTLRRHFSGKFFELCTETNSRTEVVQAILKKMAVTATTTV